jgi:ABC-type branched-subunit amino acid transport system ATPase component/branched-subunit amino acid ABC-type transport system permease component
MLSTFLPFIVIGITTGAAYGLAATGLVLTYKTAGIFNFAYGAFAALSIFVFFFLHDEHGWPWPLAALICVGVLAPIEGLAMERLARALDRVGTEIRVVATVGILLLVLGVGTLWYGQNQSIIPSFLPTTSIHILGVNVSYDQIIVTGLSIALTVALYLFFRHVRAGIAMRAVVDNPALLSLTGESPVRVRRWAWLIGSVFASLAGLMLAPALSLDALIITMLVVQAFGAAAIGYFSNLPLTFAGGLVIGIAGALATKYVVQVPWLAGLPASLPFAILFIALIVTPRRLLLDRRITFTRVVRPPYYAPPLVRGGFGTVVVIILLLIPGFAGAYIGVWSAFLIEVMLLLSLGLLVRTSGQLSLCQYAFAAIGAATFSHLADDTHVPWLVALLGAIVIAVLIGALLAVPAIRLSGVFLALATFGFGIFVEQMFYNQSFMFGSRTDGVPAPRPHVALGGWHLDSDTGFYYVILLIVLLATVFTLVIQRGRLGRLLRAMSDSALGLEAYGTSVNLTKVVVFCISAAMASVSGALLAMLFHYGVGGNYASFNSLTLVAVVVIATVGDPWYAVLGALGLTVLPGYWTAPNVNTWLEIAAGFFAVVFALQADHVPRVPRRLREVLDRVGRRKPPAPLVPAGEAAALPPRPPALLLEGAPALLLEDPPALLLEEAPALLLEEAPGVDAPGLDVSGLTVRYGQVTAVRDVSLRAPMGGITGLVGPNGAGKTTIFNACCGLLRPSEGRVVLHGRDVTRSSPSARARRGLGRTFQKAQLFDSLTVGENVALGREAALAGANPLRQLAASRPQARQVDAAVTGALAAVGMVHLAGAQAGLLSTGQKRLVELARVLAGGFDVILLDEPSSGLDATESRQFGDILQRVVAERGVAVLLVEHDMELVMRICRHVYVLDFGLLIFEGTAQQMTSNSTVRTAYLGERSTELDAETLKMAGG